MHREKHSRRHDSQQQERQGREEEKRRRVAEGDAMGLVWMTDVGPPRMTWREDAPHRSEEEADGRDGNQQNHAATAAAPPTDGRSCSWENRGCEGGV